MGSMGKSKAPKIPQPTPAPEVPIVPAVAPVTPADPQAEGASEEVRRRIRAQQGRQSTFIVPVSKMTKSVVGDA